MSETIKKVGFAVGGLIVGGLLVAGLLLSIERDEDEDRPPIIVKGGSIIFESGDPGSSEAEERIGKPWISHNGDWQPDHANGKKSKWFAVQIRGALQCPALSWTKQVTVTYTAADNTETTFTIGMRGRPKTNSPAPAITGPNLNPDNSGDNPTLTYGTAGQGRISRVRFQAQGTGNVDCADPAGLKLWMD